jgi:hypothetical protein
VRRYPLTNVFNPAIIGEEAMMRDKCYTISVSCDKHDPGAIQPPVIFRGHDAVDCNRERIIAGWKRINGVDLCPVCANHQGVDLKEYVGELLLSESKVN